MIGGATLALLVAGWFGLPLAWLVGADRRKSAKLIAELNPECRCRRCERIRAGIIDPVVYGPHPGPDSVWSKVHFARLAESLPDGWTRDVVEEAARSSVATRKPSGPRPTHFGPTAAHRRAQREREARRFTPGADGS